MGSSFRGSCIPCYPRSGPAHVDGVEDVDVVVVGRPVTAAKDDEFFAYGRAGHGSEGNGDLAHHWRTRPVEGVGIQDVELVEARPGIAAAKYVDIGSDHCGCVGAQGGMW